LAARLIAAQREGSLVSTCPGDAVATLEGAEAVQDQFIATLGSIAGWKLGATMAPIRVTLGLPRPFFGAVPAGRVAKSGILFGPWSDTVGIESEYAFRFGRNLTPGESVTKETVANAIESVHAAFEIPASRYAKGVGGEGGLMLVADNGAGGWIIVGEGRAPTSIADLVHAQVRLSVSGELRAEGNAEPIDGAPFEILAEFVRLAHKRGYSIEAGQFVVTGSCTGYTQVPLGAELIAEFTHIGRVRTVLQRE
jgi:2-keto-4-pentenoate hydratase